MGFVEVIKIGYTASMSAQIIIDPQICHGKPVIEGTRTPVSVVLGHLAAGDSMATVCREYDLSKDDIRAAVRFGVARSKHDPI